jgi:hypothetical protein
VNVRRLERFVLAARAGAADSTTIVLAAVALTLAPALVLAWAWRRGHLRHLEAQSRIIFQPRDWRVERPWESPAERLTCGELVPPVPGEWGDGA